ncbi:MAG: hypothetical protein Q8Q37_00175 [bacterium]|nr:hypothetical protein [bacterium]
MKNILSSKFFVLILIIIIAFLQIWGNASGFLLDNYWLEEILHLLGGAWLASALLCWLSIRHTSWLASANPINLLSVGIGLTAVIGLGWEFYEYFLFLWENQPMYLFDTLLDLSLDFVGAACLIIVWRITTSFEQS